MNEDQLTSHMLRHSEEKIQRLESHSMQRRATGGGCGEIALCKGLEGRVGEEGWQIRKRNINEVESRGKGRDSGLDEGKSIVRLSCAMPD